ncbi:MAG TPA: GDSL-type esterase/lipase family protein [Sphingomicrobium sp.]
MDSPLLTRRMLVGGALALPAAALAQPAGETWDQRWARELKEDFSMQGRYRADNERIIAAREKVDIVFLGDSITEGWKDQYGSFFKPGRVGRGIGGQTTPQMLLRMIPDVVDLKPRAVHIMAGTNDIASNTGAMTQEMTRDNIRGMAAIAGHHKIKVILASIPPAANFPWRPGLNTLQPIRELNRWIRSYAAEIGATYVDYHPALANASGGMKPGMANDGVHPTVAGYQAMERVIEPVLRRVLG